MQSKKCCCCCCEHNTLQRTAHVLLCLAFFIFIFLFVVVVVIVVDYLRYSPPLCSESLSPALLFYEPQPCRGESVPCYSGLCCRIRARRVRARFFACAAVCEGLQAGGFKPPISANCKACKKKSSPACTRDIGTVERLALCQKHNKN